MKLLQITSTLAKQFNKIISMIKLKVTIVTLLHILIFFSCSNYEIEKDCRCVKEYVTLAKSEKFLLKSVDIPVKGFPYDFIIFDYYENSSKQELYYYSPSIHGLISVDLTSQSIERVDSLIREGPGEVYEIGDLKVISPDSIFAFNEEAQKLYLLNQNGKIKQSWDISSALDERLLPTYVVNESPYSRLQYLANENSILFQLTYELSTEFYTPELYKYPQSGKFDLNQNRLLKTYGEFPPNYFLEVTGFEDYFPSIQLNDKIFFSYAASHKIGVHNLSEDSFEFICARSCFLTDGFLLLPYSSGPTERNALYRTAGYYTLFLYDKYRNVFYRIAKHKQANKTSNKLLSQYEQSPWSIMVLDKHLKLIHEVLFEKCTYNFDVVFVGKEGLWISKENRFNEENEEESLSFDLFDISNI